MRRATTALDDEECRAPPPPPSLSREQRIRRAVRSATARWHALCAVYVWPVWTLLCNGAHRREAWELWRMRAAAYRDANAVRVWAALNRCMYKAVCAALALALLGGFALAWYATGDAGGAVVIAHPLGFLRESEPGGTALRLPSAPLQCDAHLQNENAPLDTALLASPTAPRTLAALRDVSVRALAEQWRCVCAPMFGTRVRMTSVRGAAAATVLHLYDVTLEPVPEKGRVQLAEPLAHLFPLTYAEPRAGVLRYNEVLAHYRALGSCERDTFVLRGKAAYCVQTCDDLMAGNVF